MSEVVPDPPGEELEEVLQKGAAPKVVRYALAIIGGAIPFAGGLVSGAAGKWSEEEQARVNHLLQQWLKLQEDEIREIGLTMVEVMARLDLTDARVRDRVESPEYLKLVKKCFRDWSAAESEDKRVLIRNLLANAAATDLCDDDVVRMFVSWIDRYSEAHFKVIAAIFNQDALTRGQIWTRMGKDEVREDSADADLFKLLIQELNMGHVIRQHREVDAYGNFVKAPPQRTRAGRNPYYKSAFMTARSTS